MFSHLMFERSDITKSSTSVIRLKLYGVFAFMGWILPLWTYNPLNENHRACTAMEWEQEIRTDGIDLATIVGRLIFADWNFRIYLIKIQISSPPTLLRIRE